MTQRMVSFYLFCILVAGGCAGSSSGVRLAGMPEGMCKHCNCLMPAGTDPDSLCAVCHCGKRSHQCVRGR